MSRRHSRERNAQKMIKKRRDAQETLTKFAKIKLEVPKTCLRIVRKMSRKVSRNIKKIFTECYKNAHELLGKHSKNAQKMLTNERNYAQKPLVKCLVYA